MLWQVVWLQKDSSLPPLSLLKVGVLRHLHCFPLDSWAFVPWTGCCGNPQFPLWPVLTVGLLRSIVEQLSSSHLLFPFSLAAYQKWGSPFSGTAPVGSAAAPCCPNGSAGVGCCCTCSWGSCSLTQANWGPGDGQAISVEHTLVILMLAQLQLNPRVPLICIVVKDQSSVPFRYLHSHLWCAGR